MSDGAFGIGVRVTGVLGPYKDSIRALKEFYKGSVRAGSEAMVVGFEV